jgi:hypothetical protein
MSLVETASATKMSHPPFDKFGRHCYCGPLNVRHPAQALNGAIAGRGAHARIS